MARKLVGAKRSGERPLKNYRSVERGAERGAGCNRQGLSDGAANRPAPLRSHALVRSALFVRQRTHSHEDILCDRMKAGEGAFSRREARCCGAEGRGADVGYFSVK